MEQVEASERGSRRPTAELHADRQRLAIHYVRLRVEQRQQSPPHNQ